MRTFFSSRPALLLLFGSLLCLGLSCKRDPAEIALLQNRLRADVERAQGVEILYSDSASVKVRITAPVMLQHLDPDNPRQEFPDGVHVQFFGPGKTITGDLTAQYGIRYEQKDLVEVEDSVVWKDQQGQMLETEKLSWNSRDKKVRSDRFVVITRPEERIYGHGFEANQDFSNARILAIEGRIKVPAPERQPPDE